MTADGALHPTPYDRLAAVAEAFNDESWRGRVLMASGLLEEMLKDLIAAYMTDGAPVRKLFDGDQAPLGSLGARTCVAESLGLISAEESRDLEILRKVRNKFAHHANASFERRDIRDMCMEMKLCEQTDNENGHHPAYRFMNSALMLHCALPARTLEVRKRRCKPRPDGLHWWEIALSA